jgi:predicted transposase YbfD/YdcC
LANIKKTKKLILAIDGKDINGAKHGSIGKRTMVLSAIDQKHKVVMGQVTISDKSNEIPAIKPLLKSIAPQGAIITADAIHTQVNTAKFIVESKNDYLFTVKENQKNLLHKIQQANWESKKNPDFSILDKTHGRVVQREITVLDKPNWLYIDFPYIKQISRIKRIYTKRNGDNICEIAFCITSLPKSKLSAKEFLEIIKGHWTIENNLHWQRDYTYKEDKSQVRKKNAPSVMATFRNLVLNIYRFLGITKITQTTKFANECKAAVCKMFGVY